MCLKLGGEGNVSELANLLRINQHQLSEVRGHSFSGGVMRVQKEIRERPRDHTQ